jgi:phosphoribosyl-AMP cyclohydrolase
MCIIISAAAKAGGVARDLGSSDEPSGNATPPAGGVFLFWGELVMDFSKLDGLIPAVIQDAESAEVLMVGFMNEDALEITRRTGFATFFSRTRNTLWTKGETSGNRLEVVAMLTDCDDDTVLVKVKRLGDGNVCHTGERTCFFKALS